MRVDGPVQQVVEQTGTVGPGWPDGFGRGEEELDALLVLTALEWVRPLKLRTLAWSTGSAGRCLAAIRRGHVAGPADVATAKTLDAATIRRDLEACGARIALPGDDEYDPRISALADPPPGLFLRGRPLVPGTPRVAVVGTRRPSRVGSEVAETIAADLASLGVCVVSGAANGIDSDAHGGAVAAGGPTIAVLAEGITDTRGGRRGSMLRRVADHGTVVSEAPPRVRARKHRFPARNRIVAALASGVVVVEGGVRSGALITVDHANDLGVTVLAVPGAVTNPMAAAPIELLRSGAVPVRDALDICEALRIAIDDVEVQARRRHLAGSLGALEARVLDAVGDGVLPEHVAQETGLSVPEAIAWLLRLEVSGLVSGDGGRFRRRIGAARIER